MHGAKSLVVISGACLAGLMGAVFQYAWSAWKACAELGMQWRAFAGLCAGPGGPHDEYILVLGYETMASMAAAGIVVGAVAGLLLRRAVAGRFSNNGR